MRDEVTELIDAAIYKEIASQAYYIAGQNKTRDPGARALMRELDEEELRHAQWLEVLKDEGLEKLDWCGEKVPDLWISEYLTGGETLEDASVQDTLLFAMKREQQSVDFYSRTTGAVRNETAKHLCERLVHEELKHKLRLEILYDEMLARAED